MDIDVDNEDTTQVRMRACSGRGSMNPKKAEARYAREISAVALDSLFDARIKASRRRTVLIAGCTRVHRGCKKPSQISQKLTVMKPQHRWVDAIETQVFVKAKDYSGITRRPADSGGMSPLVLNLPVKRRHWSKFWNADVSEAKTPTSAKRRNDRSDYRHMAGFNRFQAWNKDLSYPRENSSSDTVVQDRKLQDVSVRKRHQKLSGAFASKLIYTVYATIRVEFTTVMQDLESDLFNFDTFFSPNNDEGVDDLWTLAATSSVCHDDDLLDVSELEPLSPMKEEPHQEQEQEQAQVKQEQAQVKHELSNKLGLKIVTKLDNGSRGQFDNGNGNGTPTATLPARFALLSTTCVYEPGFTTSPRGKRRISQTHVTSLIDLQNEVDEADDADDEDNEEDTGADSDSDEPFMLTGTEDYGLPIFTDAELSAMVESPSKISSTSTTSASPSPLHGFASEELSYSMEATNALPMDPDYERPGHDIPEVINMFNSIYDSSQNFLAAQQQAFDLTSAVNNSNAVSHNALATASQTMFAATPGLSFNTDPNMPASNDAHGAVPFDYFSPSGYAAAANQFLDSYGQQVQPFFLNPEAALFQGQQANAANVQLAAVMAMANSAAMNTMFKMNANYGVPIAPVQRRTGSMPPPVKVAAPLKPRLHMQRTISATSTSSSSKSNRLAITPDIADFKLVQIFHQFCDPATKVLTLPRFQQLVLHHQIKEESASVADSATDVTPDAQTLFTLLDINGAGSLDLERFMHSFQICNRCTEVKRRAHQALCAIQGQTFTPTALERQLMEDVAPVVVRVVPTRFEGHKVKSCEHYQWTWCEGFDKTGNEKCRGTNRHDKCPKYLANCTLWKHKLPPKTRKPKMLLENVDSPTKKLKHFS